MGHPMAWCPRRVAVLASLLGLALLSPVVAAARPPQHLGTPLSPYRLSASPRGYAGAQLILSRVTPPPGGARPGRAYVLGGTVADVGTTGASGRIVVHLLRIGGRPITIGSTVLRLRAHGARQYRVRILLPRSLPRGSYALIACARRGAGGALGCVTAERHLQIGPVRTGRGPAVLSDYPRRRCSPGARSLSRLGAHLYPETGNGGYTSIHTDVFLDYDATQNLLLAGTHVALIDRATQCLTDFSLDFERSSPNATDGPDMTVQSVLVNGRPAGFKFVQPTYPGDPQGQDDPDPRAHEASQNNPVGGPGANPLPPACSPELMSTDPSQQDSLDGTQCPANKLVITPRRPIRRGMPFVVQVSYTGRPGVHNDGDGTTEGWFRNDQPGDEGSFVTTEPVGTEDWMPLNDHPSAKPSYDFYDTVTFGKTAIANGELISQRNNRPSPRFPDGSTTWHWHSPEGVASYLVENSIGSFDLSERLASSGIQYYEAQDSAIPPDQAAANKAIMDMQEDIVNFQSMFNGPFPFTTDGIVIGVPSTSFEEEMQTKITFAGGEIDLGVFNHENMHQWWGDNVSESNYNLTFFKEGLATFGEYLFDARNAQSAAGGPGTPAGDAAFENSLVSTFDDAYADTGSLWTAAPSDPRPFTLFSGGTTYTRPGIAYIALRRILGPDNFAAALRRMQRIYRQSSITESELEAGFRAFLADRSGACRAELDSFFTEWFDTAYPAGGGANKPQITAPGLDGVGFNCGR
jgi:Peptidase family M1 domain